jgi:hypothetical protein
MILAPCLLALLGADLPAPAPAVPRVAPEASLQVLAGRAELWCGTHRAGTLHAGNGPREIAQGYLELGPRSELELGWSGLSSVHVHGPAALEWSMAGPESQPRLYVYFLSHLELEVRRGRVGLNLAGGLALDARRGAYQLRALAGGHELRHHGGSASRLFLRKVGAGSWSESQLLPGERLRLAR